MCVSVNGYVSELKAMPRTLYNQQHLHFQDMEMLPKSFSIQNFSIRNPCYLMKRIPTVCSTNLYWDRLFRHRLYRDRLYRDRFSPRPFVLRIFGCVLDAYVTYSIYIFIILVAKIFGFSSLVSFSSSIFHNDDEQSYCRFACLFVKMIYEKI